MKPSPLACCLSLLLLGVVPLAQAQEEEAPASPLSGTFAVTSDYLFRGISQTNEEPAFQAGLTYTTPFGVYIGTWTSNVDYGAGDPDWEVDGFLGYNTDLGTNWNFDVMVNRYQYLGAGASNYAELMPEPGFVLEPGGEWVVDIDRLDYPLRHWTDGGSCPRRRRLKTVCKDTPRIWANSGDET